MLIARKRKPTLSSRSPQNNQAIRTSLVRKIKHSGLKAGGIFYIKKISTQQEKYIKLLGEIKK
ncbi:hypothetical protein VCSRO184_0245 [Vibrio cholerae]|nr:hypothetical protein VCSRO184_0245 [Vibrio cholerae]